MSGKGESESHWRDAETLETMDLPQTAAVVRVPALTILYHADLTRVGQQCRLVSLQLGKSAALSRLEPIFAPVGQTRGAPLSDPRLSRRPIVLSPSRTGGIQLDGRSTSISMTVDGAPVNGVCEVASERLDVGVVLTLKSQCVLLLHRLGAPITPGDEFGMVGHSEAMHSLRSEVSRVADLDVPVLLRGESGSGKELVARAIHARSGRASSPFVPVNMAAINTTTAASELFGHVRGAFTGANREHGGFFGRANGGTLFLDEVGELSPEVQVMLLRALESGEIQPVGGASARRVDVRFIAATDSDLEQATLDGAFRVPLFHRLAGYQVVTPPLRDRLDDIARLFVHFLRAELEQVRESHRLEAAVEGQTPWLPASLMCRLVRYTWPGNVRQLRNVARQLVIASRGRDQIQVDETVERLLRDLALPAHDTAPVSPVALKRRPREIGEDELIETLRAQAWRLGPTAAALGMSRTTLYGLIERSSRIRKARDLSAGEIQEALGQFGGDSADAAAHLEVSHRGLKLRMKELGI